MPEQGEIKWTTRFITDKETVVGLLNDAYIEIDELGSYKAEALVAVAPYLLKGIAGTLASLGQSAVSMALSTFKSKCKSQIHSCLDDIVSVPPKSQIAIMAKYRWTDKEDGNWMPQYEIKHLLVESV